MFKKLVALPLSLMLLAGTLFAFPSQASADVRNQFSIVGEWLWASTIYDAGTNGAEKILSRCKDMGITDVYLLVKGTAGTVYFNNTNVALKKAYPDRDILQDVITAAHAKGIRVHAWLTSFNDAAYKAAYPDSGLYHYVRGRDNDVIHPLDAGFNTYMENLITELATNYDIDGLHLDYIRYNHVCNGWSAEDFAAVVTLGSQLGYTNVTEVSIKNLIDSTFYNANADPDYIFNAYNNNDATALSIAQYRRNNVVAFATRMVNAAKAAKRNLIISGATMPDGAVDEAFGNLHYGQSYKDAASLYDYICPMAYSSDYSQNSAWVARVTTNAIAAGNKVVTGLQSYYPTTSSMLVNDVEAVRDLLSGPNAASVLGIAHFRTTQFSYAKLSYDLSSGTMNVKVINTNTASPYQWVQVEMQQGLTINSASAGTGMNANAQVSYSDNNRVARLSHSSLLPADSEGNLSLSFTGTADPSKPIALVRVYITNESRAYHVYAPAATPAPQSNVPKTGDASQPLLWGALALCSLAGISVIFARRRKQA